MKNTMNFETMYELDVRYGHRNLFDCYKKPSTAKMAIWAGIVQWANELGGHAFIISYNGFVFTAGIQYVDPVDGCIAYKYITPTRTETVLQ